jgi:thymidylate synthase
MIRGETNVRSLQEKGIRIWDEWARADGDLGPVYGKQWRRWQAGVALQNTDYGNTPIGEIPLTPQFRSVEIDQLKTAVERIKADPDSRRNIVTAWNPAEIPEMALPPCHCFFQFYVAEGRVSCQMYQRSADLFLGVPFNIASYALLTHLVAHATGLEVGTFVHTLGDAHIYVNHVEQVKEQLRRAPKNLPSLHIAPDAPRDLFALGPEHVALAGYESHPPLYGEVAV